MQLFGVSSVLRLIKNKDLSFHRISAVINHIGGERERELSQRRRDGCLDALSRQGIIKTTLANIECLSIRRASWLHCITNSTKIGYTDSTTWSL